MHAYDARLLLAPGTPTILRRAPESEAALDLLSRVRARGHGAVACDLSAVVSSDAMTSMKRFRLGPTPSRSTTPRAPRCRMRTWSL